MSRLKKRYKEQVREALNNTFKYSNTMMTPKLLKIVINSGIAAITKEKNAIQDLQNEYAMITGQRPIVTRAKKSIAGFKLREGQPLGVKVTLRGEKMWDFLDRFVNIVAPRISDFRGFTPKGDNQGNYTLGIEDHQIFPELNLDEVKRSQGMNITFVTSANKDDECIELLRLLGVPFNNLPVTVTI